MVKKLKQLACLVGLLLVVIFISNSIDGIMHELIMEVREKITTFSFEQLKQQLSGKGDAVTYEGNLWNVGFVLMWFLFQWIMLTRCKRLVFKLLPLAITVALWILAEVAHVKLSDNDFTAYALCYVTLHWMFGAWVCCVIGCIRQQERAY